MTTTGYYQILEKKQKFQIKTYIVLIVILVVGMGTYTFLQWQDYNMAKKGTLEGDQFLEFLKEEAIKEKTSYDGKKVEFDGLYNQMDTKLATIFPPDDAYTSLTRQLDDFEQELAKLHNPFEISNINYQGVVEGENYSILPLRMNIRSSASNFTKFLHLIENSGTLNEDIRLMDLSSIRLSFEEADKESGEPDIISFSVQINAYFQK